MSLRDRIGIDLGKRFAFEDAIDWASANDVRVINIGLDGPQNDPATLTDARVEKIREKAAAAGVKIGLHTLSAVNTAEDSPFVRDAVDAYLESYVDAAARLGCAWIVVHGGYHFTKDVDRRTGIGIERLKRIGDIAGQKGTRLLLENMNKEPDDAEVHYLACYLDECQRWFGQLPAETVGWAFTVNHAHMLPEKIRGFVDGLDIGRCDEVRIADNKGDKEEHLQPGDGTIDFREMFDLIEGAGFRGHYMNAFGSREDMLAGRDYLVNAAGKR